MTELRFDPVEHKYFHGARQLPSVTHVLQPYYEGLEFVDWQRLAELAAFGNHVHEACHLDNIGELDEASVDAAVAPYLAGWRQFKTEARFIVSESELRVHHKTLGYAGTLDNVGWFPGKKPAPAVVDIKTGAQMPKTVGPQTAAYNAALGLRMPRYCCLLGPGTYNLVELKDPRDFDIFKAALTLYRWRTGL